MEGQPKIESFEDSEFKKLVDRIVAMTKRMEDAERIHQEKIKTVERQIELIQNDEIMSPELKEERIKLKRDIIDKLNKLFDGMQKTTLKMIEAGKIMLEAEDFIDQLHEVEQIAIEDGDIEVPGKLPN